MNAIKVEYQGSLQQKVTHLASGQIYLTDGPSVAGGKGEVSAPTDLLIAAYTSCAMTIMALTAEQAGANFNGCYAESGKVVSMEEFRISEVHITFHLKAAFPAELRQALEKVAVDTCIVGRSLNADMNKKLEFIYE
ncbi:OsmC family protein [Rodentibacter haemolyticus]|uniref:OsmC family protein n=1 Tax=Rodentibacter haemolyticus TaxID=2778911 RepID=A0ABX6V0R6_9PAST|nr:OsmC family protein [Rodentibacter haemolyticus]QPB43319.1 OsmC family protein [Rodentibacter haemolyticus]